MQTTTLYILFCAQPTYFIHCIELALDSLATPDALIGQITELELLVGIMDRGFEAH